MTDLNSKQTNNLPFLAFIKENTPTLDALTAATNQKPSANTYQLIVPRQLKSKKEDHLLEKAFTTLFHLDAARQTRTSFDVENHPATEGNRLVKKKHPLNIIYDVQYVAAKTQIKSYLHREPYTVPYNRMALRIYGRCFLFAQLELVAQTGIVPDKLGADFYFLPKGTFVDEFEEMHQLALSTFIDSLATNDYVQFHPLLKSEADDLKHSAFLLNDTFVWVDTSETLTDIEEALEETTRLFFLQKVNEKVKSSSSYPPFTTVGIYRARFGKMERFELEEYFKESLDDLVKEAVNLLK